MSTDDELTILAMKNVYDTFVDVVWKAIGFILIGIGWICTSDGARIFIASDPRVRWGLTVVALISGISNVGVLTRLRMHSVRLEGTLPPDRVPEIRSAYLFGLDLYIANLGIVQSLIAVFVLLVWITD